MAGAQASGFRVVHLSSNGVSFVKAFKDTRGRMPDNLDHRRLLVLTDGWKSDSVQSAYGTSGAWSKTLLGKAAKGERIRPGNGLRDFESSWLLPDAEIRNAVNGNEADPFDPANALSIRLKDLRDGKGNHLLAEPEKPFDEGAGVTVISESILVVPRFAASGVKGKVDEKTGFAVEGSAPEEKDNAWNRYPDGELLRPGARGDNDLDFGDYDGRRSAYYYGVPSNRLGVLEAFGLPAHVMELADRAEAVLVKPVAERTAADDAVVRQFVDAVRQQ